MRPRWTKFTSGMCHKKLMFNAGASGGDCRSGPAMTGRGEAPPDSVDPKSVTKNPGFWLPMGFAESSVTKEGRFWLPMQPDGLSLLQGCATEWPPGHMAVKK